MEISQNVNFSLTFCISGGFEMRKMAGFSGTLKTTHGCWVVFKHISSQLYVVKFLAKLQS